MQLGQTHLLRQCDISGKTCSHQSTISDYVNDDPKTLKLHSWFWHSMIRWWWWWWWWCWWWWRRRWWWWLVSFHMTEKQKHQDRTGGNTERCCRIENLESQTWLGVYGRFKDDGGTPPKSARLEPENAGPSGKRDSFSGCMLVLGGVCVVSSGYFRFSTTKRWVFFHRCHIDALWSILGHVKTSMNTLGGGFIFFILFPTWGNYPIWRAYSSNGLKPTARLDVFRCLLLQRSRKIRWESLKRW